MIHRVRAAITTLGLAAALYLAVALGLPAAPGLPAALGLHAALGSPAALGWLAALGGSAKAQEIDYAATGIVTTQLAPDVYALTGSAGTDPGHPEAAGGRIGVLVGPQGVLMVDAQY